MTRSRQPAALAALATLATILLSAAAVVLLPVAPAGATTLPRGFSDDPVAAVGGPTALAFTPDGRMLVTTQGGTLRVVANGTLLATPALDLTARICSTSERGLLGVAVDPAFPTNHLVSATPTTTASESLLKA